MEHQTPPEDFFAEQLPVAPKKTSLWRRLASGSSDLVSTSFALRRRDSQWRFTAPVTVGLIVGFLLLLGLASLFLEKPTVSQYENRALQKKPEFSLSALLSGSYTKDLENYFADTFPLREQFVKTAGLIEERYGLRADDVRIHKAQNPALENPASQPAPSTAPPAGLPGILPKDPEQETPPEIADDGAQGERLDSFFIYKGKAFSIFSANNDAGELYADTISAYRDALGEDVTIYNLVIPTAIEFSLPERYRDVSASQKDNLELIYGRLDPSIKTVDAYKELLYHRDEYLYFGTDHHWTGLGAYYAYLAFCQTAGLDAVDINTLEKRTLENFIGTLYSQAQDSSLLKNPDHVDYWLMPNDYSVWQYRAGAPYTPIPTTLLGEYAQPPNSYSVFLQGDFPLTHIQTDVKNGRKIAVVKESFGNAFAPFLVNNYEDVYVIDQRYFELNLPAFIKENEIDELLFINNIFAANTYLRIQELSGLMTGGLMPQKKAPASPAPKESAQEPATPNRPAP